MDGWPTLSARMRRLMAQMQEASSADADAPPAPEEPVQIADPRMPLGLPSVDRYLGGGLRPGSIVVLLGAPFMGKELMADLFLSEAVRQGEGALAVLTDRSQHETRQRIESVLAAPAPGIDLLDLRGAPDQSLPVDLLSRYRPPKWSSQSLCRDVTTRLDAAHGAVARFVWASLSTFHAIAGGEATTTALLQVVDLLRSRGITGLILVDPVSHSVPELQFIKRQVDGVIELRRMSTGSELRLEGLGLPHASPWVRFRQDANGIAVTGYWRAGRIA